MLYYKTPIFPSMLDDNILGESKFRAENLPNEIWTIILRYLFADGISAVSVVSKPFFLLVKYVQIFAVIVQVRPVLTRDQIGRKIDEQLE